MTSLFHVAGYVYGREWKYVLSLLAVVGLLGYTQGLPDFANLLGWVLFWTGLVGSLLIPFFFLSDTAQLVRRWRAHHVFPLADDDPGALRFTQAAWCDDHDGQVFVDISGTPGRVGADTVAANGAAEDLRTRAAWRSEMWVDTRICEALWRLPFDAADPGIALGAAFRPTKAQADASIFRVLQRWGGQKAVVFNGRQARLGTEPALVDGVLQGPLTMSRATFFDGESSNELWRSRVGPARSEPEERRFVVAADALERGERMLSLDASRMANIVGVSIIAVTADQQLLFVRQTRHNSVAGGRHSASGSGSLDWRDVAEFRGWWPRRRAVPRTASLYAAVTSGMLREMYEESGVQPDDNTQIDRDSVRITSYFRWLDRGAKPEFTGIVRLRRDADFFLDQQRRKLSTGESVYSAELNAVPLSTVLDRGSTDAADSRAEIEAVIAALQTDGSATALNPSCEATVRAGLRFLRAVPEYVRLPDRDPSALD